jgi:excisionase family DNA binding protein
MLEPTLPVIALSVPQAAKAIGVSEKTMWKLIRAGKLRHARVGARVLVPVKALEEFVLAGGAASLEPAPARDRRNGALLG